MKLKKRNESNTITALIEYLQTLQNLGHIRWHFRIQCGAVLTAHKTFLRLAQEGSPDLLCVTKNGVWISIEAKSAKGGQEKAQVKYEKALSGVMCHKYILARSCDDVTKVLKEIGCDLI